MVIYRCAACGSPNVTIDTKEEGYSLSKAVVGTMLIGSIGALAGINGKTKNYYHCPDCGITLSYPMGASTVSIINKYLEKPDANATALSLWKNRYKNIEWNPGKNLDIGIDGINTYTDYDNQVALKKLAEPMKEFIGIGYNTVDYEVYDKLKLKIKKYCQVTKCKQFMQKDLEKALGADNYKNTDRSSFTACIDTALLMMSDYVQESDELTKKDEYGNRGYIVLDEDQQKAVAQTRLDSQVASKIWENNKEDIIKAFLDKFEYNRMLTETETEAIFFEAIIEKDFTDDPGVIKALNGWAVEELITKEFIMSSSFDDGTVAFIRLNEEGRKALEEEKEKENLKNLEEANNIIAKKSKEAKKIFMVFEDSFTKDQEYTFKEAGSLVKNYGSINKLYSTDEFKEILTWCVYCDLLEYKNKSFSKVGGHKRNVERKKTELSKVLSDYQAELSTIKNIEEKLSQEKIEAEKIIALNKNKIFGAGAKARKEAQARLLKIENDSAKNNNDLQMINGKIIKTQSMLTNFCKIDPNNYSEITSCDSKDINKIFHILKDNGSPMSVKMVVKASKGYFNDEETLKITMKEMENKVLLFSVNVKDIDYFVISNALDL